MALLLSCLFRFLAFCFSELCTGEREAYSIFFDVFLVYLNEVVSDPDDWISHASAVIVLEAFHQDDSANKVL